MKDRNGKWPHRELNIEALEARLLLDAEGCSRPGIVNYAARRGETVALD